MKSLNLYFTRLSDNRGSDGSGIRFGKYPPKRIVRVFECSFSHIFKSFVS